jgi:hypothetical protein
MCMHRMFVNVQGCSVFQGLCLILSLFSISSISHGLGELGNEKGGFVELVM